MLEKVAIKLFGNIVSSRIDSFSSVKDGMRKARMTQPLHEYMSTVFLYVLIVFIFAVIFSSAFVTLALIFISTIIEPFPAFFYTLAIIISVLAAGVTFALGFYYPSLLAHGIKGKIDKALPFAVFYMATSASSGVSPVEIFRLLSLRGGELGTESKRIYTNVKTLGMDLNTALQRSASRSPSANFSELLYGISSLITSGGDLEEYLRQKTKAYMAEYRRSLQDYSKTISLYTEIYITLIIVGSLFFIILIAIISPLTGGDTLFLQTFIVFFFIPLVSSAFIMLLKSISPVES